MDEVKCFVKDYVVSFMLVNNYFSLKEVVINELFVMLFVMWRIFRKLDDLSLKLENGELFVKVGFFFDEINVLFIIIFIL